MANFLVLTGIVSTLAVRFSHSNVASHSNLASINSLNAEVILTSPFINVEVFIISVISLTVKVKSVAKQAQNSASGLILCRWCVSRLH